MFELGGGDEGLSTIFSEILTYLFYVMKVQRLEQYVHLNIRFDFAIIVSIERKKKFLCVFKGLNDAITNDKLFNEI